MKTKNIFIAGQSGFLGSELARRLRQKRFHILPHEKKVDLTQFQSALRATRHADIIVNAAGIVTSRVDQEKRPASIFYTNSLIQFQLLQAAAQNRVKDVISICSIAAYPLEAPSPLKEEWLMRGTYPDVHRGASYYALSKWLTIPVMHAYTLEHHLNASVVVFPNLYGPGDKFDHPVPPLVPNIIKSMYASKTSGLGTFHAGGGPGKHIELMYVDDAIDFLLQVLQKQPTGFSIMNAGFGRSVTIENVCKVIRQNLLFRGTIVWSDSKKSVPRSLSNTRSRVLFKWQPRVSLEEGIAREVGWYLDYVKKNKKK